MTTRFSSEEAKAAIEDLYNWSTNFDAGKGPFTLFLDIIGYSEDEFGETLYPNKDFSSGIGYLEAYKLGKALMAYSEHPRLCEYHAQQLIDDELED